MCSNFCVDFFVFGKAGFKFAGIGLPLTTKLPGNRAEFATKTLMPRIRMPNLL